MQAPHMRATLAHLRGNAAEYNGTGNGLGIPVPLPPYPVPSMGIPKPTPTVADCNGPERLHSGLMKGAFEADYNGPDNGLPKGGSPHMRATLEADYNGPDNGLHSAGRAAQVCRVRRSRAYADANAWLPSHA